MAVAQQNKFRKKEMRMAKAPPIHSKGSGDTGLTKGEQYLDVCVKVIIVLCLIACLFNLAASCFMCLFSRLTG